VGDGLGVSDAVFTALADPTRRAVLEAVADDGPASATALATRFPVTRQAVAKHLAALEEAGLVRPERAGREVRWSVVSEPLDGAAAWMAGIGDRWDRRIAALRRHLQG
jgi:DNA-binding transcriptional ArsR family regulator